jgi:glucose/mannose-6-phosphate isomerase
MNLDDLSRIAQIDVTDMRSHIDGLPDQFQYAWDLGHQLPLPAWEGIERVLVAGMGGSAIGADLVAAYIAPNSKVPLVVHRNYDLPAWTRGSKTLVVASSHSGNTEETLSSYEAAIENHCRILILTTGGKLAQMSQGSDSVLWQFKHEGQPRTAVGFSAGLLLAALTRLGLISDPQADIHTTVQAMRTQQESLELEIPTVRNPAKRIAGQIYGRWVAIIGADILEPVARRWKTQISEIAKAWGQFEAIPEVDHNTLAGVINPGQVLPQTMVIFLRAPSYHPRNQLRSNLTKSTFMLEGINTDFIDAQGPNPLAHQWTALHFGDYTAFYLAMAYGVDPTAIPAIEMLKEQMANSD